MRIFKLLNFFLVLLYAVFFISSIYLFFEIRKLENQVGYLDITSHYLFDRIQDNSSDVATLEESLKKRARPEIAGFSPEGP